MLKRILICTAVLLSIGLVASVAYPQHPKITPVAVKDTPASQTLNQIAKDEAADQQAFQTKLQQARFSLDQNTKTLNDQVQSLQKELQAKLEQDKKYKPILDQIAAAQKKLATVNEDANTAFTKDTGAIQQKLKMESDQAAALIPVVRKENDFPEGATYDMLTQKWSLPAAPKGEAKK